jgi:hypothetical protein
MNREEAKARWEDTFDQLKTLRDEVRLDLHLASMELRDEWAALEKRLPDAQTVDRLRGATREALGDLTEEVRGFLTRLREKH